MALDCGQAQAFVGKDRERVQRDVDKTLCTTERQCIDGDKKLSCSKRSIVAPSKEDPNLFLGYVWCPCAKDLPAARTRSQPIPIHARPPKSSARKPVRKKKR